MAAWTAFFFLHPAELVNVGVGHYRVEVSPGQYHELWFLDTVAILASTEAATNGMDPYQPNRLDYMQRPHVYGPAWLYLRYLGLNRSDTLWVGAVLGGLFLLTAIAFLRPRHAGSLLWCSAVLCTTPVLAALERGNNDLVVFLLLTPMVPCVLSDHAVARWLAPLFIILAAALKYYPAVACVVLLVGGSSREVRGRIVLTVIGLALAAWHVVVNVPAGVALPAPRGLLTFGAVSVFHELGFAGAGPAVCVLVMGAIIAMVWWRTPWFQDWQPAPLQRSTWTYFALGSSILTGCFFFGQHFAYRWIFSIWLAPLLWILLRDRETPRPVRQLAQVTAGLLLVMLWAEAVFVFLCHGLPTGEMMRRAQVMTLVMQLPTWIFFVCLLGFLVHFVRAPLMDLLLRRTSQPRVPAAT